MKKMQFLLFCFISLVASAQTAPVFQVYLVGDAGEEEVSGKALLMLEEQLLANPNSAVVFLGDNVYPSGFSYKDENSKLHLESQLNILRKYKGQAYFIPGNHDWDKQRRKGLQKIKEQQKYVDEFLQKNSTIANKDQRAFFPADGLPGPESVMLNDKLRLIMFDTQWFLHFHKKNKLGTQKQTVTMFYKQMDSLLEYSGSHGQQVLITAHHPMYTNGEHSRKLQPWRFFVNCTPFKIFGYCGLDRLFSQDLYQPGYKRMRKRMLECLNKHPDIIYASGHEHNVQYFKEKNGNYIVSGNGSKTSALRKRKRFESFFQDDSTTGFVKLEYFPDGKIVTSIHRVGMDVKVME
jgi:hypothetical protein